LKFNLDKSRPHIAGFQFVPGLAQEWFKDYKSSLSGFCTRFFF
jgi:hypothetical protein